MLQSNENGKIRRPLSVVIVWPARLVGVRIGKELPGSTMDEILRDEER